MKKVIALTVVALTAAIGTGYTAYPDEFARLIDTGAIAAQRLWAGIEANPVPVIVAFGTFVVTIVYHKAKGKSLRESVEVAATRVRVVSVPAAASGEPANPVVQRAQARATRTQLIADQIALENRIRALPGNVKQAEKDACYTENAVAEAEKSLIAKRQAHEDAAAKLEALRKELADGRAELSAIAAELKKLADVV